MGLISSEGDGESVEMVTLDSFNLDNVSFIKIDVEGHEIEVLKGARATLERNKPVMVIEVYGRSDKDDRLDFIRSLGYDVTHISDEDYLCVPIQAQKLP